MMMRSGLERAIVYIEENLEADLSLHGVAEQCNYSSYHFSVLFHQYFGETMKSYIKKRRLTRAAEYLKNTNRSIIDIAIRAGYSSQAAFSRAFTDVFGTPPHKYRQTRMPIQETNEKQRLWLEMEEDGLMNDRIKKLQGEIERQYSVNILHVLNGVCMLSKFQNEQLMNEQATYLPFNEAMCWGEVDADIFSPSFVQKRVASLQTTEEEYQVIVLDALKPLLEQRFDIVVLWFGDDMFCQMNMITVLAYLEQSNYSGDVLFCMALERKNEMLDDAVEIEIGNYRQLFEDVLCRHQQSKVAMMPVTYQAVQMYLGYRDQKSPIITYIKNHAGKENLLADLLTLFPEYGLGDRQYQMLIDEYSS